MSTFEWSPVTGHSQLTVGYWRMDNYPRLALDFDGDGTAKLNADVHCEDFCGSSSAWFGVSQLERFSEELAAYPLPPNGIAPMQGGFWSKARGGELDQLRVSFKVYPIGLRGAVGYLVTLRTPLNDGDTSKVSSLVEVELRTSYEELSEFSKGLKRLARGEVLEAILRGVTI
jgi:hypothetical protein